MFSAEVFCDFLILAILFMRGIGAVFRYPEEAPIAEHKQFPWYAILLRNTVEPAYGATIASRYYVLTVCKRPRIFSKLRLGPGETTYSNIRVVAGTIYTDPYKYQGSQVRWIYYWEDHPKCRVSGDSGYRMYDISVIKVSQMFIFNDYVAPMPFETDQMKMRSMVERWINSAKECTFAGFGGYRFLNITTTYTANDIFQYDNIFGKFFIENVYTPAYPDSNLTCCISKELRVMQMELMDYELCRGPKWWNINDTWYQPTFFDPPVDVFCARGAGEDGGVLPNSMKRSMICDLDYGSPLVCDRDDGGGKVVIGHAMYGPICRIENANGPSIFNRYDWVIHEWIMQFYNPRMYGDHWVDPEYNVPLRYCNHSVYTGPIPPYDPSLFP